jgi:hypothetical protein
MAGLQLNLCSMRKFLASISVLFVLLSFSAETAFPLFAEMDTVVVLIGEEDKEEKKEEESKNKEDIKDKIFFDSQLQLIEDCVTESRLQNISIRTFSFRHLPEMPPDLV